MGAGERLTEIGKFILEEAYAARLACQIGKEGEEEANCLVLALWLVQ